jgi:hypothetical protein
MDARERTRLTKADPGKPRRLLPVPARKRELGLPRDQVVAPDIEVAAVAVLEPPSYMSLGEVVHPQPRCRPGNDHVRARHSPLKAGGVCHLDRLLELLQTSWLAREELHPAEGRKCIDDRTRATELPASSDARTAQRGAAAGSSEASSSCATRT